MRIVFYSYFFTPIMGGLETTTHMFAKELVNFGHEVHVVTSNQKISPNDGSELNLPPYEIIEGIHVHRIEHKPKQYPI